MKSENLKSEKKPRCEEFKEQLLEVAASTNAALPPHARECADCAAELASLRSTMQLLDQWTVPEPSPYFDTRLKARLREESAREAHGWRAVLVGGLRHLRVPVLALATFAIGFTGYTVYQHEQKPVATAHAPDDGVHDLQSLDKQYDTLAELESLDDAGASAPDTGL